MRIITKNNIEEYYIERVVDVYIGFEDFSEARLSSVSNLDIYLTDDEFSIIKLESNFCNEEIMNHLKGNKKNHVTYVNMELEILHPVEKESGIPESSIAYQLIPCDMKITGASIHDVKDNLGIFTVELMGKVK